MSPESFAEIWDGCWPGRKLTETALKAIWGPDVQKVNGATAVRFLREWARSHQWPPSLHEFLVGMGMAPAPLHVPVPAEIYDCEWCGKKVTGPAEYVAHLDADHADRIASPEVARAAAAGWQHDRPL